MHTANILKDRELLENSVVKNFLTTAADGKNYNAIVLGTWVTKRRTLNHLSQRLQLVSVTHDFKFEAPDGKQRFADALDSDCVQTLAKAAS